MIRTLMEIYVGSTSSAYLHTRGGSVLTLTVGGCYNHCSPKRTILITIIVVPHNCANNIDIGINIIREVVN